MGTHAAAVGRRTFLRALGALTSGALAVGAGSADTPGSDLLADLMDGADPSVRPQDDLYRHVNGRWLRTCRLAEDEPVRSAITEIASRVQSRLRAVVEGIADPAPGSPEQQIRDLYAARMDTAAVERLGMRPLADPLARIEGADGRAELARVMGELPIPGLITVDIAIDHRDTGRYLPRLMQSGLGMERWYYRRAAYPDHLDAYRVFLERVATGAGFDDPAGMARRTVELEVALADAYADRVRQVDADQPETVLPWSGLRELMPGFAVDSWLAGQTGRAPGLFGQVLVDQPAFLTAAARLWTDVDIGGWRDYLRLSLVQSFSRFLPEPIAAANFEFRQRFLGGVARSPERTRQAVATVDAELGHELGRLYVAAYFSASARDSVGGMVADLMAAHRRDIESSTWMTPPTRAGALAKLDTMRVQVGYPDRWPPPLDARVEPDQLVRSLLALRAARRRREFARLGTTVAAAEWTTTPQTVNAFYSPTTNAIVFPAAFLQAPYFDRHRSEAVNYGAIGAVIGHEIGHAFDDHGSRYDGAGVPRNWWTEADLAAFAERARRLVVQFDALVPEGSDGRHVDGSLTADENMADLRGLRAAVAAYLDIARRRGDTTPDLRPLFLSWARCWRTAQTPRFAAAALAGNTHAPAEFRTNQIVRNIPEFYAAFDVGPGDRLYLPEPRRLDL